MENDQFMPLLSPRWQQGNPPPLTLSALPEDEELGHSLTPSEFKDRLIFGPSIDSSVQSSSPSMLEAFALASTPKQPSPSHELHQNPFLSDSEQPQDQQWLIDPDIKWKKTNLHRSKTAPAMATINEVNQAHEPQPEQLTPQCMIRQAFLLLVIYLSFGIIIYWFNRKQFSGIETHPVVDALYFCIVTMCTIGYGDITPNSTATKLFSILFVLVGFGFIDILLSSMVTYVLDLEENYILSAVKARKDGEQAHSVLVDVQKGRMRIRMKVALALGVVVLCIGIGVGVLHYIEQLGWLDSFYLSVMSVTTVGYGDRAFKSLPGRVFASIWLLVSTLAVARAFLYLAEFRVDKRNRKFAKWALGQDMTVSQFLAADIDCNGFVSKSEYVIYKLKEMGKISDKDIVLVCKKFDELDSGNNGKITLADLMRSH
uniref:Potassium channel domain-containing protein n=1 Tax=Opuntia streptacantha TaxID=393608 RepID=A0A7C9EGD8_OPUST